MSGYSTVRTVSLENIPALSNIILTRQSDGGWAFTDEVGQKQVITDEVFERLMVVIEAAIP